MDSTRAASEPTPDQPSDSWKGYLAAAGFVGAGFVLRAVLREFLGVSLTYLTFFPAVVLSALYRGMGPGLLSIVLSVAAVAFFSKPPFYRPGGVVASDTVVGGTFVLLALCICAMGEALRRSRSDSQRRLADLTLEVSRRKEAEQAMRQQWETFDLALSHSADFIYMLDLEGRFTYANTSLLTVLERSFSEMEGRNFFQIGFPTDLATRLHQQIREVIDTRTPLRDEAPFAPPSGELRRYEYIFAPVIGAGERVEAIIGCTRDTTERTRVEEALRKSEERLMLALEAGRGAGAWDWDLNSGLIFCSSQLSRLFDFGSGSASEGVTLESFLTHIHPDDRMRISESMQRAMATRGDLNEEYRAVQKDRAVRWLSARGRSYFDATAGCLRLPGVVFDITEFKAVEQSLRESKERLRAIYDGTYEYICLLASDGTLLEANRACLEFSNSTGKDVIGTMFWNCPWFSATPGAPETIRTAVSRAAAGQFVRLEATLRRPSGELLTFDMSLHPIRDQHGDVILIVPEGRNITERKRVEEEVQRSNQELKRANRELEEFGYVASHDLQEPLRTVNIYTQLILRDLPSDNPDLSQYASFVTQGVHRMEMLIRDLLRFTQAADHEDVSAGVTDLNTALQEATAVLESRLKESGAIVRSVPLPRVRGNNCQLAHVFQNLLSNAMKYRRVDERPVVEISCKRDGNFWVITVRDNGIGFDPQYADRIFGLFKRLHKTEYPGTGLGLAICRRIIERYGGRIWADSCLGRGSAFHIALPLAPEIEEGLP